MTPTHCVMISNHINCPGHDQPHHQPSIEQITSGFRGLLEYIAAGRNQYRIDQILVFDKLSPVIEVRETYEGHSVDKIIVSFEDNFDNKHMLGPWTLYKWNERFSDAEDNDITPEFLDTTLGVWHKARSDRSDKSFARVLETMSAITPSKTVLPMHEGQFAVYRNEWTNGPLHVLDTYGEYRLACQAFNMHGVYISSIEEYTDEFWARINAEYPGCDNTHVFITHNFFLFQEREDAEKLFNIMNDFFENKIYCLTINNQGMIENENA